ncbi:transglycosylase domain-containing protein [Niallia circulans]
MECDFALYHHYCGRGAFGLGIGAGYFASLVKDEPIRPYTTMQKDIYNYEETSELFFANNEYLGKVPTDLEREEVKIKDVSPYLKDAVIATEDENFYTHNGVVPKAIFRALFQEVANSSTQSGGSTLTQQLIKNQILTNEVSFERKAKEILLALRLEKFFEKDEILEAYLNVSTLGRNSSGRNIAGVQSAANGIFGVDAKDLTLPQAAFIVGLPQSPFGYTPFTQEGKLKKNLEPGLNRMKTVLNRMYDQKKISKQEYDTAMKYDITKDFIGPQKIQLKIIRR